MRRGRLRAEFGQRDPVEDAVQAQRVVVAVDGARDAVDVVRPGGGDVLDQAHVALMRHPCQRLMQHRLDLRPSLSDRRPP